MCHRLEGNVPNGCHMLDSFALIRKGEQYSSSSMEGSHKYPDPSKKVSATSQEGVTDRLLEHRDHPLTQKFVDSERFETLYGRKQVPTDFLHKMDWGIYLRLCCQIRHLKKTYCCTEKEAYQLLQNRRNCRRNCIIRLVIAFNHLYSEYSEIFDLLSWIRKAMLPDKPGKTKELIDLQGTKSDEAMVNLSPGSAKSYRNHAGWRASECKGHGDTESPVVNTGLKELNVKCIRAYPEAGDEEMPRSSDQPRVIHSIKGFRNTSTSLGNSTKRYSDSLRDVPNQVLHSRKGLQNAAPHVCFRWCYRAPRNRANQIRKHQLTKEALRLARQLNVSGNLSDGQEHLKDINHEYFDRIQREPQENTLLVYQLVGYQYRVEHRIKIPKQLLASTLPPSHTIDNEPMISVRLPIALELVLPKIQRQIDQILRSCQFVYDPLEVVAELRQLNYDTDACVTHFNSTRYLRDIIREFLPSYTKRSICDFSVTSRRRHCESKLAQPDQGHRVISQLLDLKAQINLLKKTQQDAFHRVTRLRKFASDVGRRIGETLEVAIVSNLCTLSKLERDIHSQRSDLPLAQLNKLVQENRSLKQTLRMEENRRKTVFNMMQEYLGNVRVYCRCRAVPHSFTCVEIPSIDTVLLSSGLDTNAEQFKFDRVFDAGASQAEVYTELAPSVCSFLDGYNVCFLTYGGEASGKTYTLLGAAKSSTSSSNQGIAQRALHTVLSEREARQHDLEYRLSVAVIEVYNDTLIDLLANEQGVHVHIDSGLEQIMEGLELIEIHKELDVENLISLCQTRRRTGCTALNTQSSRSHLIIFVKLKVRSRIHEATWCSVLALCDLAGFEDVIKADTLSNPVLAKEAGYINRSLTALNRVFMALRTQEPNAVSYRDSKLTYLLKPFFTHSGKCILIVTVRTDRASLASTQGTLRFGREARGVSLGRQRRQFNLDKLIDDLNSGGIKAP